MTHGDSYPRLWGRWRRGHPANDARLRGDPFACICTTARAQESRREINLHFTLGGVPRQPGRGAPRQAVDDDQARTVELALAVVPPIQHRGAVRPPPRGEELDRGQAVLALDLGMFCLSRNRCRDLRSSSRVSCGWITPSM